MAGSVNKVILVGNLGGDPEVRYLDGGSVVARFNIATNESYRNRSGELVEQTEWHRIELWENLAKIAEQYLKKGSQVYVEGRLRSETWQDKEGVQRTGVRIRATGMTLLGGRPGEGGGEASEAPQAQAVARPAAAAQPAPQPEAQRPAQQPVRREPDPVPSFDNAGGDDDLPF
ncbi:single-stranded DNA-binding protein [Tellurirhabdus bombi]|uniref:single-stranded DNA-binding protein n=1 Tax=Tellurirhabdus bombi TaxID=2907205 RepID=UPI001F1BDC6C|nr:single-stranded DNA-binding protein [Tellurirhabdus bombi]